MYELLKLVHVAAVIIFLGNVITGLFWKHHADKSGDLKIVSHTMEGIIRSDRLFTIPGVVVITAAGIMAAIEGRIPLLRTGWIFWSIVLFSLSGFAFMWRVAPLQRELLAMTRATAPESFSWSRYRRQSLRWELWGCFATITPLIAVVLMVMKWPA